MAPLRAVVTPLPSSMVLEAPLPAIQVSHQHLVLGAHTLPLLIGDTMDEVAANGDLALPQGKLCDPRPHKAALSTTLVFRAP